MRVRAFASYGEKIMRMWITRFVRRCVSGVFPLFLLMKPLIPSVPAAAFAVCSLACPFAPVQAGEAARTSYDIAPGDAVNTLKRFADESGRQVVFLVDAVRGVTTNPVRGEYTVREALTRLVADTGLVLAEDAQSGALMLNRIASREPPPQPEPEPEPKTQSMKTPRTLLAALTAFTATILSAQTASVTASNVDPVKLSPFEVTTDRDVGYAAQDTLSGTRMRTPLRDIGASLAVLSPEFLADLGVTSFDKALIFTPSVDTFQGDNEANLNGTQARFNNGQVFSLRGFVAGPSASHDFFSALERNDIYNVEQITLARGPNAMLFGLGGSAGASVSTIKRAYFAARRPTVALQTDRWGSWRAAFDANLPLVPDKLALRVNVLKNEKHEFRRYEGLKQGRVTLGARYRPFRNTEIVVNHEEYRTGLNQSPVLPPFDTGALRWVASGRPTVEFVSGGTAWTTAGRNFLDPSGRPVARPGGGLITTRNDFDPTQALGQQTAPTMRYVVGLNLANPVINYRWATTLANSLLAGASAGGNFNLKDADPWNLFGLPRDANLFPGTWDNPARRNSGRWTSVFVEQKLAQSLHLELAGNFARDRTLLATDSLNIISIDVDRYLPNGQPNPGYLIPYSESQGGGQDRLGLTQSNSLRATLSYEYDLSRVHRWLGNQSFSALAQADRVENELDNHRVLNRATAGLAGFATDMTNNNHQIWQRAYYVNGRIPDPLPSMFDLSGKIDEINSYRTLVGATAIDSVPANFARQRFLQAVKTRTETDSLSLAWIGRFFQNRLVTTAGFRRDAWELYGVPAARSTIDPEVAGSATQQLRQYFDPASQIAFNAAPTKTTTSKNKTYGAVFRATTWLDLTASRSSNFTPNTSAVSTNYLNQTIPDRRGETKDYGLRAYAFDGKLTISLNQFETVAENETRNAAGYTNGVRSILTRLRDNYATLGDSHFRNFSAVGALRVENTQGLDSTWNYVADGYELAATFNPNPRWRFYVSGSSNKNVLGAHVADLAVYLNQTSAFEGLPAYARFVTELRKVASGQASNAFDLDPNNATDRAKAATDATFIETQTAAVKQAWEDDQALTGRTTNRNGKYSANGMVTHTFDREGWLKGLAIGGNFRWRSASTVGYERKLNAAGRPLAVIDVSRPIEGEEYWEFGLMVSRQFRFAHGRSLRLQLNIENPLDWDDSRVVATDYDSQGYYGTTDAIIPIRYELRRPRNFTLTATYTF